MKLVFHRPEKRYYASVCTLPDVEAQKCLLNIRRGKTEALTRFLLNVAWRKFLQMTLACEFVFDYKGDLGREALHKNVASSFECSR